MLRKKMKVGDENKNENERMKECRRRNNKKIRKMFRSYFYHILSYLFT